MSTSVFGRLCLIPPGSNRAAKRFANFLLGAACPASVLTGILHRDGEVIAGAVVARQRAGGALGPIVLAPLALWSYVVENAELLPAAVEPRRHPGREPGFAHFGNGHAPADAQQVGFAQLLEALQVLQLIVEIEPYLRDGLGVPVAVVVDAVDAERSADGVAKFACGQPVLAREDLDPIALAEYAFDRYAETKRDIVNVDPALAGQQRRFAEDPKVAATARHLQRGLDAILAQFAAELGQGECSVVVVGIDCDPLAALSLGVDRIQANGDVAGQVFPQRDGVQLQRFAGGLVDRLVIMMPTGFLIGLGALPGIGPAVDEQLPVVANVLLRHRQYRRGRLGEPKRLRRDCGCGHLGFAPPWVLPQGCVVVRPNGNLVKISSTTDVVARKKAGYSVGDGAQEK